MKPEVTSPNGNQGTDGRERRRLLQRIWALFLCVVLVALALMVLGWIAFENLEEVQASYNWVNALVSASPFWGSVLTSFMVGVVLLVVQLGPSGMIFKHFQSDRNKLAERLAGPFTKSVLNYHPASSELLAGVLSEQVRDAYTRLWARPAVEEAGEAYRLKEVKENVWVFDFVTTWTWLNDSCMPKRPLDDFVFGIAPTIPALRATNSALGPHESGLDDYQTTLRRHPNFFIANVAGLGENWELIENIDRVLNLRRVSVSEETEPGSGRFKGPHVVIATEWEYEVEKSTRGKGDGAIEKGVYYLAKLPARQRNIEVPREGRLRVRFEGTLSVRGEAATSRLTGSISFQPSDVVAKHYELAFIVAHDLKGGVLPESIKVGVSHYAALKRDSHRQTELSSYVKDKLKAFLWGLGTNDDKLCLLTYDEPVLEQDLFQIDWSGEWRPKEAG